MAVCSTQLCARYLASDKGCVFQRKPKNVSLQGWNRPLGWGQEMKGVSFCPGGRNRRQRSAFHLTVVSMAKLPQNVDMPPLLPKRKKRPSINPTRKSWKRRNLLKPDPKIRAPANGFLVKKLIPVAHDVMQASAIARKGVDLLLKKIPVQACSLCSEVSVGIKGHDIRTCQGPACTVRRSAHVWVKATTDDVIVPIEAYHLADRLGLPVSHDDRFTVDRIPAIEELCIQAGVDVPGHPTLRYTEPAQPSTRKKREDASWMRGKEFTFYTSTGSYQVIKTPEQKQIAAKRLEDAHAAGYLIQGHTPAEEEDIEEEGSEAEAEAETEAEAEAGSFPSIPLGDVSSDDDLLTVAHKTFEAWERMKTGARKLMVKYRVVACGYCSEIHVGPRGHRARACGAFKHQWRNGMHGWQDASLDELIPPRYVWHVRDRLGPPLENALRKFYGKAPALVELCVQAGIEIPESYKPLMRLDIAIPTLNEFENVI